MKLAASNSAMPTPSSLEVLLVQTRVMGYSSFGAVHTETRCTPHLVYFNSL